MPVRISTEVYRFAFFAILYAAALVLFYGIAPVSDLKYRDSEYIISLFYFPHAANTIGAWVFGWRIVLYLIPISIVWYMPYRPDHAWDLAIAAAGISALAQYVYTLDIFTGLRRKMTRPWVEMLIVGTFATLINLAVANVIFSFESSRDRILSTLAIAGGQVSGLVLGMIALMFLFRVMRQFFPIRIDLN